MKTTGYSSQSFEQQRFELNKISRHMSKELRLAGQKYRDLKSLLLLSLLANLFAVGVLIAELLS